MLCTESMIRVTLMDKFFLMQLSRRAILQFLVPLELQLTVNADTLILTQHEDNI